MMRHIAWCLGAAALVGSAVSPARAGQAGKGAVKAIIGARVIDGTGRAPLERATIVIRDGRIEAIGPSSSVKAPAGAEAIDLTGKTIVPGLVNAHAHVADTRGLRSGPELYTEENLLRQLGLYARYGVTTVFSLGGDGEAAVRLRAAQRSAPLDRARLFIAGPAIGSTNVEEALKQVDAAVAMKADVVKIRVDDNLGTTPKMPEPVFKAVIEKAHKHGLRVAAHVFYLEDARALLKDGADFIAHSIRDRDVDAETIALFKQRGVCLCPTLTREVSTFTYETTPAFFSDPFFLREADPAVLDQLKDPKRQAGVRANKAAQRYKVALEVASRNLKKLADAGVRLAFGTDTGPVARFQGYFEHMELELMTKAGLTPMQAIVAATGDAARCTNQAGRLGTIQPGAAADLIVLTANPLDAIANTKAIESVWIAGNRVPSKATTDH